MPELCSVIDQKSLQKYGNKDIALQLRCVIMEWNISTNTMTLGVANMISWKIYFVNDCSVEKNALFV